MLWVYDSYKYFHSFSAGVVFICQNLQILTYKDDPRTETVNIVTELASFLNKLALVKI